MYFRINQYRQWNRWLIWVSRVRVKSKHDNTGGVRSEEVEEAKKKLAAKLNEAEEQLEQALAKCNGLEKAKQRIQNELDDITVAFERANSTSSALDKKQKQFDRSIAGCLSILDYISIFSAHC